MTSRIPVFRLSALLLLAFARFPLPLEAGQALVIAYTDFKVHLDLGKDGPLPTDGAPFKMELGHAGILLISDAGKTSYFEYGRYDAQWKGRVRQVTVPDVRLDGSGHVTPESLRPVLRRLSSVSGQNGRIRAAYVTDVSYDAMHAFALRSMQKWPDYQWYSNNCTTYADLVLRAGKPRMAPLGTAITMPLNLVNDYVTKGNGDVSYNPNGDKLTLRKPGSWWDSWWQ